MSTPVSFGWSAFMTPVLCQFMKTKISMALLFGIREERFPCKSFQIHYSLLALPCNVIPTEIVTAPVSKRTDNMATGELPSLPAYRELHACAFTLFMLPAVPNCCSLPVQLPCSVLNA
jgi:hypothetical protein